MDEEVESVGLRGHTCGDHVSVHPCGEVGAVMLEGLDEGGLKSCE